MPFSISVAVLASASKDSQRPKLVFDGTQRVVLGRGPGCDVRIPDVTVSHRHASLRSNAGSIVLVDEGSTNGTFVDGKRLDPRTPCTIKPGSAFRMGNVEVLVSEAEGPATRDVAFATRELAMQLVQAALAGSADEGAPIVRVVQGPDQGKELVLRELGTPYRVGREKGSDLELADSDVSRTSVELVRTSSNVVVRNTGARNPLFVGDVSLPPGAEMAWRAAVPVRIAKTWLTLEEPILAALAAIESADDSRVLGDFVETPVVRAETTSDPTPPARETAGENRKSSPNPSPRPGAEGKVLAQRPATGLLERALATFAVIVLIVSVVLTVWLIRG